MYTMTFDHIPLYFLLQLSMDLPTFLPCKSPFCFIQLVLPVCALLCAHPQHNLPGIAQRKLTSPPLVWEVLLYMCCFYWLMNKEASLACDRVE